MANELATYLHDHLAGARFAISLLEDLCTQSPDQETARLSAVLQIEIDSDRAILQELAEQIAGHTNAVKDLTAWVAQKLGRLKLDVSTLIGSFEAIEALCLGVQGKLALWNALRAIRDCDDRLVRLNLDQLASRAIEQFARLEAVRLRLAKLVLEPSLSVTREPGEL